MWQKGNLDKRYSMLSMETWQKDRNSLQRGIEPSHTHASLPSDSAWTQPFHFDSDFRYDSIDETFNDSKTAQYIPQYLQDIEISGKYFPKDRRISVPARLSRFQGFKINTDGHHSMWNGGIEPLNIQKIPYSATSNVNQIRYPGERPISRNEQEKRKMNRDDSVEPCNTLYIGNLPVSDDKETLDNLEKQIEYLFKDEVGFDDWIFEVKKRGIMSFVQFDSVENASRAKNDLSGTILPASNRGGIRLTFSKNELHYKNGQRMQRALGKKKPSVLNGYLSPKSRPILPAETIRKRAGEKKYERKDDYESLRSDEVNSPKFTGNGLEKEGWQQQPIVQKRDYFSLDQQHSGRNVSNHTPTFSSSIESNPFYHQDSLFSTTFDIPDDEYGKTSNSLSYNPGLRKLNYKDRLYDIFMEPQNGQSSKIPLAPIGRVWGMKERGSL